MESQYYCVYKLIYTKLWRKKPKLSLIQSYSQKLYNSVGARRTAYFFVLVAYNSYQYVLEYKFCRFKRFTNTVS